MKSPECHSTSTSDRFSVGQENVREAYGTPYRLEPAIDNVDPPKADSQHKEIQVPLCHENGVVLNYFHVKYSILIQ